MTLDIILQRIARLQQPDGLFPSVRRNDYLGYQRADTNVFFTAVTVFTLQQLRPTASAGTQRLIDAITERAVAAYPRFQNKDGLKTYNFWPTRPSHHFPNGYVFHRFDHFRIPDDIDDTAMVYLTSPHTTTDVQWLHDKLAQHANGVQLTIRNTYADYRSLRAYSTWFGKNMPIDFDACALSNMLYCLYQYQMPPNQHDTDSLRYLRDVVESGRYASEPFCCAPHYARTSLIIYHLARLIAAFAPPELDAIRPRLINDARHLVTKTTNRIEQIVLLISLLRLGKAVPAIDLSHIEQDFDRFHFFIAGLLTAYENPLLRRFADRPLTQMRWQCEAHNWALIAEYVGLHQFAKL
ncbi:hypothetical protein [Spirosoma montaniterrae]|uniref:Uncharacterized protein n=1 Tax=Spirosoma montaniterrae TaxID=1178516 RepID=A0A1P9WZQ6_9BACT|nr:hypothetical protein [Spirosoma montaniterrae]AQG80844.1 hypothetical protein AWR27_16870 [Spirosoma montaniterrae]